MDIAMDHCEECGKTDVIWWGLDRFEERIAGRPRILCERCWRSMKGWDAWHTKGPEDQPGPKPEPALDIEEWFPGKDEREAAADGDERKDWQE